jgi:transcriptional regulator with XRE-family HTH domain
MDDSMRGHWTRDDPKDFVYRIGFDFVSQLKRYLATETMSRDDFAKRLGVSKGRVSQVMNNPGDLRLLTAVRFALALGKKVSVVAYDDGDPENQRGPVNSAIFEQCWTASGKPTEFGSTSWTEVASPAPVSGNYYWPQIDETRVDTHDCSLPAKQLTEKSSSGLFLEL